MIGFALNLLPQKLLAESVGVLLEVAVVAGVSYHYTAQHYQSKIDAEHAAQAAAIAKAAEDAAAAEHAAQEKINAVLKAQNDTLNRVNVGLRNDLNELRSRPSRPPDLPEAGRADCKGGSGAELSREDAEFLAWEAARADTIRASLQACYAALDAQPRLAPQPTN